MLCVGCRTPLVVGVLGCMAERLKSRLLDQEKLADLVVGPDAYRDLPRIITAVQVSHSCGQIGCYWTPSNAYLAYAKTLLARQAQLGCGCTSVNVLAGQSVMRTTA